MVQKHVLCSRQRRCGRFLYFHYVSNFASFYMVESGHGFFLKILLTTRIFRRAVSIDNCRHRGAFSHAIVVTGLRRNSTKDTFLAFLLNHDSSHVYFRQVVPHLWI